MALPLPESRAVGHAIDLLEQFGVRLGHPYSSAIKGSSLAMRELRIQHAGSAIRVLYVFDPDRQAVLILGGDKSGDKKFYQRMITKAEALYADYLKRR